MSSKPPPPQPLPKFGEWDVKDPSSADGFTVIFAKAGDEKRTNSGQQKSNKGPPPPPPQQEMKPVEIYVYRYGYMVLDGFIKASKGCSSMVCLMNDDDDKDRDRG